MIKKILEYLLFTLLGIILIILLALVVPAEWHYLVTYPQSEKQVNELSELRKEPDNMITLKTYRGVLHVHSYWSHDSEGTLFDIIPAARNNGIDFIFLSDHPHGKIDTLPRGYNGYYDEKLIVAGSEEQGFNTWPLDSMIIDWNNDKDTIAQNVVKQGGLIFYSHTEEPHNWANPWYQGMEIYNFHTDTKDEFLIPNIINFMVNGNKFRHWAYREMFDEQTSILALWDSLNTSRKIVGFSAVDVHENQNIRARRLKDGRVEWIGPNANVIDTTETRFWHGWLFHAPDTNGWIFSWKIDTYNTSFNYITNYVFADTLSVKSLAYHLKKGHLFTAFKSLGDAKGFIYYSLNSEDIITGIPGDSVNINEVKTLNAVSPLPGQYRLMYNGKTIDISSGENYKYSWTEPVEKGAYRIEMHLKLRRKFIPWIYSNPIYIF